MNKIKFLIYFLIIISIFTSCIPQKELVYLQDNGTNITDNFVLNSTKPYQVQLHDILLISIKTIDPKFNNFFAIKESNQQNGMFNEQSIYFNGYSINSHGKIRIPLLGEVLVFGLTIEEVRKKIELNLLKDFFTKESGLFVDVKLGGIRVTLNGEVAVPGTRILYFDKVNVLEAIANAGDITMLGDRKDVMIIRQTPIGTQTAHLDLTEKKIIDSPFYYLQPNDYIYVKPLKQKSWGTGATGIQSFTSIVSILSLATTLLVLFKK
jgi:polysaccharide export outer membrane protein